MLVWLDAHCYGSQLSLCSKACRPRRSAMLLKLYHLRLAPPLSPPPPQTLSAPKTPSSSSPPSSNVVDILHVLRGAHYTDTGPCVFRDDVYVRHIIPACYVYATYVSDILYGSLLCTHVCVKLINVKPVHAALVEILPFHFSTKLVPKKQLVTVLQLLLNMLLGVDPLGGGVL